MVNQEGTVMGWILYIIMIVLVTGAVGLHLRRFPAAYTEMLGMMTGMTMGMMGGFTLGYAAALVTQSMFWGNLFGILLGVFIGLYFGQPGGLMGAMDGGMAGFMAGAMGAMLAVMLRYPEAALLWTAGLLTVLYAGAVVLLIALVEQRAPEQAALHLVARWFPAPPRAAADPPSAGRAGDPKPGLVNYYELLGIPVKANGPEVATAYSRYIAIATEEGQQAAEAARATLANPAARARYDQALALASGREACCAPPRRSVPGSAVYVATAPLLPARATPLAAAPVGTTVARTRPTPRPPAPSAGLAVAARPTQTTPPPAGRPKGSPLRAAAVVPVMTATAPPPPRRQPQRDDQGLPRRRVAPPRGGQGGSQSRASARRGNLGRLPVAVVGAVLLIGLSILGLRPTLNAPGAPAANNTVAGVSSTPDSRPAGPAPVVAALAADGVQTADLVVDGDTFSYQPRVIQVKQGMPVRLNLKTTGRDPGCARLVTIRGLGVQGRATPGQVVPFEFTPRQAGTYEINCGMSMMQPGTLIVTQ
jgi:hypothetical protein